MYEKIKALCDEKGISVTELERILQFGNGTIHRWSRGKPTVDNVVLVADYFGIGLDELINPNSDVFTKDARELAKTYEQLTDDQKGLVKCYISIVQKNNSVMQ